MKFTFVFRTKSSLKELWEKEYQDKITKEGSKDKGEMHASTVKKKTKRSTDFGS